MFDCPNDPLPNHIGLKIAIAEEFIRFHRGLNAGVRAVLFDQNIGRPVNIDVAKHERVPGFCANPKCL